MATGSERLVEQISDLYLNKKLSDVTIVIDGVELPAHRVILAQRCRYFETMFESGLAESVTNRIEVRETSLDALKSVLKWIYSGKIELNQIGNDFEVLRLAHMYELTELVNLTIDYFKRICTVDNVCHILNVAVLLSLDELIDHVTDYISDKHREILKHESFDQLSVDAIREMLSNVVLPGFNADAFRAVVNWMKANPSKSTSFPDVLRKVPLGPVTLEDLAALPSDVLDANIVVNLTREQQMMGPVYELTNKNVALPKYGVKVVAGGETSFFDEDGGCVLKHEVGIFEKGIVVDLGRRFLLNSLNMHLVDDDKRNFSYWIAVSEDNINWTRIIDHSRYTCRSLQELYFNKRAVRYIRICGIAPVDDTFEVSRLEAFYTTEPFKVDPETTLLIPSSNVALASKHAKVLQGYSSPVNAFIDGTFEGYNVFAGYTWHTIGDGCIIVQLPQPYLIDSMKLLLWDGDDRVYSYHVDVSTDQNTWTRVFSEENVASWREIRFEKQPVVFIKLTGTYNSFNSCFHCVYLECPAAKQL